MSIGPKFSSEIKAANLANLPFSWGPDGKLEFDPSMTSQQRAAVLAVVAVHDAKAVLAPSVDEARIAALGEMAKLPAYRPAIDLLIKDAALDADAPKSVKDADEIIKRKP